MNTAAGLPKDDREKRPRDEENQTIRKARQKTLAYGRHAERLGFGLRGSVCGVSSPNGPKTRTSCGPIVHQRGGRWSADSSASGPHRPQELSQMPPQALAAAALRRSKFQIALKPFSLAISASKLPAFWGIPGNSPRPFRGPSPASSRPNSSRGPSLSVSLRIWARGRWRKLQDALRSSCRQAPEFCAGVGAAGAGFLPRSGKNSR